MKRSLLVGVVCTLVASTLSSASFEDQTNAEFWLAELTRSGPQTPGRPFYGSGARTRAATLVAQETEKRLGAGWVTESLKIARAESGYRCDARNPRSGATGLGQLMFGSAEILEPGSGARRTDCATGARLLALHMERCLTAGATTPALMERCHLSGWHNFGHRLNRRAERYVAKYQRMVKRARPIQVADASGWLVRGTVGIVGSD